MDVEADKSLEKSPRGTAEQDKGCQRDGQKVQGCSVLSAPPQNPLTQLKPGLSGNSAGPKQGRTSPAQLPGPCIPWGVKGFPPWLCWKLSIKAAGPVKRLWGK